MIPRVRPRRDRLKLCSGPCGQWLPVVDCFNKDRSRLDGYRSVCRACKAERESELAAGAPRRRPWATKRTIAAMAEEAGLSPSTLGGRLLAGWELEEALTKPVAPSGRNSVRYAVLVDPRQRRRSR